MNSRFFSVWNVDDAKCSTGLKQNMSGTLASLFGVVFIFVENENRFVRYCAVQSLFIGAIWMLGHIALSVLATMPLLGWLFIFTRALFSLAMLVVMGGMSVLAYRNKKLVIPVVSKYAEDWSAPYE